MRHYLSAIIFIALLVAIPVFSFAELRLEGTAAQSGLMRGHINPESQVYYGERQLKLAPDGAFIFGPIHNTKVAVARYRPRWFSGAEYRQHIVKDFEIAPAPALLA